MNAQLGDRVKDRISGLQGIVVAVMESLHGCRQVCIRPQEVKDGKPAESSWFDDGQVEVVERGVIKPTHVPSAHTTNPGGPALHGYPRA